MAAKKKVRKSVTKKANARPKAKPVPKPKPRAQPKRVAKKLAKSNAKPVPQPKKTTRTKPRKSASLISPTIVELTETITIQIDHFTIAQRAYEIWEGKGRPEGDGHQNWVEAEAQLRAAMQRKIQTP